MKGGTPHFPDVEISSEFPTAVANKSSIIKLAGYANVSYASLTCVWGGLTQLTAACGGDAGAGAGDAGVCDGKPGPSVEIIPAVLATGSFGVALAVHTDAWENRGRDRGLSKQNHGCKWQDFVPVRWTRGEQSSTTLNKVDKTNLKLEDGCKGKKRNGEIEQMYF